MLGYILFIMIIIIIVLSIIFIKWISRKNPKLRTGVEIMQGLPGSGKSTMAAYMAYRHNKKGYKVYSNFPIKDCFKLDLQKDIMKYNIEHALLLIDEAGLEYDSRDWQKFTKESTEFFKTHRHYHLRIVLFTQYWDDVDKKIRQLTNRIYVVSKGFLPGTVRVKEIKAHIGISEDKQIVMEYEWKPMLLGGHKNYIVSKVWKLFDSWSHEPLPEKPNWEKWNINKEKKKNDFRTDIDRGYNNTGFLFNIKSLRNYWKYKKAYNQAKKHSVKI